MDKYLSDYSAALYWNIPCIEHVLDLDLVDTAVASYTVSQRNSRYIAKDQIVHFCQLDLPSKAIILKDGIYVASPELIFLQLARRLDIHRLILLGLQLCSYPPGRPSKAITTKQKLEGFLAKISGHQGQPKALRAVKYIENGSASIMESMSYMILTLPHLLGGYGLSGAVFNHEINLKSDISERFGQKRCFVDLYYKQSRLAVEYDSFAFHNTPAEQGKDLIRAAILERQNIDIMRLSTIQLYDKDSCLNFAYNLAFRLGKRIQIRTDKFEKMHLLLRALLPDGKPLDIQIGPWNKS